MGFICDWQQKHTPVTLGRRGECQVCKKKGSYYHSPGEEMSIHQAEEPSVCNWHIDRA